MTAASASPDSAASQRHHNEGHGRRLTAAFEALEAFPALAESRNRVLRLFSQDQTSTAEVVAAVESDVALAIAVLRVANQVQGKTKGKVDSVVKSVDVSLRVPAEGACWHQRSQRRDSNCHTGLAEGVVGACGQTTLMEGQGSEGQLAPGRVEKTGADARHQKAGEEHRP